MALSILYRQERIDAARAGNRPFIVLRPDGWDDYGYKTLYQVELRDSASERQWLGGVKVMRRGQGMSKSAPALPDSGPGGLRLNDDYCSLGQGLSYYENLIENLGRSDAITFLTRMQDVVLSPQKQESFGEEPAFQTSLLREGSAQRALLDAAALLRPEPSVREEELAFRFASSVGGERFDIDFEFGDVEEIPSRINAVIGYNGVGKTRLMANLAHVAYRYGGERIEVRNSFGQLEPESTVFGRVIAISYSAFDTFDIPVSRPATPASDEDQGSPEFRDYVYCGLRDTTGRLTGRLKSSTEIASELSDALERLQTAQRWRALDAALAPLLREPSFQNSSTALDFREPELHWRPIFDALSTGHKISLNIIVQLVAQLENQSLVLIDEPESHLHPPLLAALMKGIAEALEETNSFAVVATHSPVVLQEVAGRYVRVLRRYGEHTTVERPPIETFGENVGILTRTVFNLDNAESDYEGVLRRLGITIGADGLASIFPDGLSSQALAILLRAEAESAE